MSIAVMALAVTAGIVLSSIPLRANLEVLGRKLRQRPAGSVQPALAPHVNSNIPRGGYFQQRSTGDFQLPRQS